MLLVPLVASRETPFSVQPLILCTDDQVRVAVWPLVMVDCDVPKKVITAKGVTVTVTACWAGLVPVASRHRNVYVLLAVRRPVGQVVAVPLATTGVVTPGTAGVSAVEMTPDVAVVSYKLHEVASDDVHTIEVGVLNAIVCGSVSESITGDAAVDAAWSVVVVVVVEVVAPPPPPHEARPKSASSKTKYAPAKWGVTWVVLRSAMLLPDPNNAILGG